MTALTTFLDALHSYFSHIEYCPMTIKEHTIPADHNHGNPISLPVRISGRSLIDNDGRVVGKRGYVMSGNGYVDFDCGRGFDVDTATDSVHQLAHAVNNAQRLAEALDYLLHTCEGHPEAVSNARSALAAWKGE